MRTGRRFVVFAVVVAGVMGWAYSPAWITWAVEPAGPCPNCHPADRELLRASELQRDGRFDEALVHYGRAADRGGDTREILSEKAYCFYALGQDEGSLASADELLELDRGNARAHYVRGLVYKRSGRLPAAREEFRLALLAGDRYAASQLRTLEGK